MSISRNQEHFVIMTVIYDELNDFIYSQEKQNRDARLLAMELCEVSKYSEVSDYIKNMIAASLNNYGSIVNYFTPKLKNWKWDRLPILTQSLLIMSYAHYYIVETDIDKKVVINVAIDLAKKYIDEKQAKFINAILDGALNRA